jgi:hypothetical protein
VTGLFVPRSVAGAAEVLENCLAGDRTDVLAGDAKVGELAVGHAAEFGNSLAILDPVVVGACEVHFHFLSSWLRSG